MSNWIDYDLDVLASSPTEINRIADRLREPSEQLGNWVAERIGGPPDKVMEFLEDLLQIEVIKNLGYVHDSVNKARRFGLSFKDRYTGIVRSHLWEVSKSFPEAVFLLTYRDMQYSYSGKEVIRKGEVVLSTHDGNHKAQAVDWALLDIFAPFQAEYDAGFPFGSLWKEWVDAMTIAVHQLKDDPGDSLPCCTASQEKPEVATTPTLVRRRVYGQVLSNDGYFAAVETIGIEGLEKDLLLETIQLHIEDTNDTPEEFQRRFPIGRCLDICATTEASHKLGMVNLPDSDRATDLPTPDD